MLKGDDTWLTNNHSLMMSQFHWVTAFNPANEIFISQKHFTTGIRPDRTMPVYLRQAYS